MKRKKIAYFIDFRQILNHPGKIWRGFCILSGICNLKVINFKGVNTIDLYLCLLTDRKSTWKLKCLENGSLVVSLEVDY